MQDEEAPIDVEAAPVAAKPSMSWQRRVRIIAYVILVIGVSGLIGGAGPRGAGYHGLTSGVMPDIADPALQNQWQSVGAYVTDRDITPAMLAHERLMHENKQIELRNPPTPAALPTVRAPLLPGPVQKIHMTVPNAPTAGSDSPFITTPAEAAQAVQASDAVKDQPAGAQPTHEDKFNEDLSTLDALRNALKALKVDSKTTIDSYRNDQP